MADTIQKTEINGVFIINRPIIPDDRGFFHETFRKNELEEAIGKSFEIVQQNHSRSVKDTLRGIHVAPWSKVVYALRGSVQQIVVDLREDSPTFKKWISVFLGEETKSAVYIPSGCGNAFLILSEEADYIYSVSDYWALGKEYGIIWNDPDLNIGWQTNTPILSDKDKINPFFKDKFPNK
jgi:dTDP-4-dehydrorhamnose 3,5-epimerase